MGMDVSRTHCTETDDDVFWAKSLCLMLQSYVPSDVALCVKLNAPALQLMVVVLAPVTTTDAEVSHRPEIVIASAEFRA